MGQDFNAMPRYLSPQRFDGRSDPRVHFHMHNHVRCSRCRDPGEFRQLFLVALNWSLPLDPLALFAALCVPCCYHERGGGEHLCRPGPEFHL